MQNTSPRREKMLKFFHDNYQKPFIKYFFAPVVVSAGPIAWFMIDKTIKTDYSFWNYICSGIFLLSGIIIQSGSTYFYNKYYQNNPSAKSIGHLIIATNKIVSCKLDRVKTTVGRNKRIRDAIYPNDQIKRIIDQISYFFGMLCPDNEQGAISFDVGLAKITNNKYDSIDYRYPERDSRSNPETLQHDDSGFSVAAKNPAKIFIIANTAKSALEYKNNPISAKKKLRENECVFVEGCPEHLDEQHSLLLYGIRIGQESRYVIYIKASKPEFFSLKLLETYKLALQTFEKRLATEHYYRILIQEVLNEE